MKKLRGKKIGVKAVPESAKIKELEADKELGDGQILTTNHGVGISDNQNSLKAHERGSTLMEDFILREKITHFDHERIPERIVHARGSAAHGFFQVYESMQKYTKANFLQDPSVKTPVFVRFSTVAGSRGSTDLARDVRGFSVKFYTAEGNYDFVGNNVPVFFIQDAMKFPDFVHAVKPEPHNEMPQAASAHDTFWDFISLVPESMHMIMWVMSDRAIPRSYRMMEGFGVHTFRLINQKGSSHFVKFHWKPLLGVHSVLWDEALKISGKDPDFHRRDLWEAIENGDFPEWELGVQIVREEDEHKFEFDLLDPTKIIPEEVVPVKRIGKMTLNRNPDNFFAETEQVAFHPGHLVPGIDFTNDPLLQGRLFSYTDTQLSRLGSPNFHEIPINRPVCPVHNNQRDGHMRQTINRGRVSYEPNTLGGGCPMQLSAENGGFSSFPERVDGSKVRDRSRSFFDHFSQAALFYDSQSEPEQMHIMKALRFELGKVETQSIQERMLFLLSRIDKRLADDVGAGIGVKVPSSIAEPLNQSVPADIPVKDYQPLPIRKSNQKSAALSMANTIFSAKTRKIAVLVADGFDDVSLSAMVKALKSEGIQTKIVAPHGGFIEGMRGGKIRVDFSFATIGSVLFDGACIPGGQKSVKTLLKLPEAVLFVNETYKHCKAVAALGDGAEIIQGVPWGIGKDFEGKDKEDGVVISRKGNVKTVASGFVAAIAKHRHWKREATDNIPV